MQTYIAVVDKEEDSAFGLWFPDVPGCFSAADSENALLGNAIQALALHLEGHAHPAARDIAELRRDADVADALAEGAYLLAVPLVTMAHRLVRANISLDKGVLDAIDAAAAQRGLTRSAFISEAARNEISGRSAQEAADV
ncbi:MAG: type II toxin-antitoxin system HicB family antitoxin [Rhodobacteraceae bacterium]|nr:type II toxin-antitoxin system HicB family antitoxin [Paracoccaceae bacterium]